jgi:hypothetical protein
MLNLDLEILILSEDGLFTMVESNLKIFRIFTTVPGWVLVHPRGLGRISTLFDTILKLSKFI